MDFFEHQQRARRRTRWLIFLFLVAVAGIAVGVTMVVAILSQVLGSGSTTIVVPDGAWLATNRDLLVLCAIGTVAVIGLASWIRLIQLRKGGPTVATSLGGTVVLPENPDPLCRRLYNVVEEISIASSVPVPTVFVMEHESSINAFAAGHTTSDAAIAVTRGALEQLSRDELQGVIGHEFSHILNGDMRLNIRLMGFLFGIMVINMVGRAMARTGTRRGVRISSAGKRGSGIIGLAGVALFVLGYIGVLVGRIIQAAVSRQREFLADASAVQFTRQASGLADALRKIGGLPTQSWLANPRAEEVSHMLFANGRRMLAGLFATHPPLDERIRKLQPYVRAQEAAAPPPTTESMTDVTNEPMAGIAAMAGTASLAAAAVVPRVGAPDDRDIESAREIRKRIPDALWMAAHDGDDAVAAVLALVLDEEPSARDKQCRIISNRFGETTASSARELSISAARVLQGDRLAVSDIAFPMIRSMPEPSRTFFLDTLRELVAVDGDIDAFEAALVGSLTAHLADLESRSRRPGRATRRDVSLAAVRILAFLSIHGHESLDAAADAFAASVQSLDKEFRVPDTTPLPTRPPPAEALRRSLLVLDRIAVKSKKALIEALVVSASSDGRISQREFALLRGICSALHCPLPPLVDAT
jgi:Zn-dependent protease with chaperone function/uncharacterized tellurite resistance protein B-like protein